MDVRDCSVTMETHGPSMDSGGGEMAQVHATQPGIVITGPPSVSPWQQPSRTGPPPVVPWLQAGATEQQQASPLIQDGTPGQQQASPWLQDGTPEEQASPWLQDGTPGQQQASPWLQDGTLGQQQASPWLQDGTTQQQASPWLQGGTTAQQRKSSQFSVENTGSQASTWGGQVGLAKKTALKTAKTMKTLRDHQLPGQQASSSCGKGVTRTKKNSDKVSQISKHLLVQCMPGSSHKEQDAQEVHVPEDHSQFPQVECFHSSNLSLFSCDVHVKKIKSKEKLWKPSGEHDHKTVCSEVTVQSDLWTQTGAGARGRSLQGTGQIHPTTEATAREPPAQLNVSGKGRKRKTEDFRQPRQGKEQIHKQQRVKVKTKNNLRRVNVPNFSPTQTSSLQTATVVLAADRPMVGSLKHVQPPLKSPEMEGTRLLHSAFKDTDRQTEDLKDGRGMNLATPLTALATGNVCRAPDDLLALEMGSSVSLNAICSPFSKRAQSSGSTTPSVSKTGSIQNRNESDFNQELKDIGNFSAAGNIRQKRERGGQKHLGHMVSCYEKQAVEDIGRNDEASARSVERFSKKKAKNGNQQKSRKGVSAKVKNKCSKIVSPGVSLQHVLRSSRNQRVRRTARQPPGVTRTGSNRPLSATGCPEPRRLNTAGQRITQSSSAAVSYQGNQIQTKCSPRERAESNTYVQVTGMRIHVSTPISCRNDEVVALGEIHWQDGTNVERARHRIVRSEVSIVPGNIQHRHRRESKSEPPDSVDDLIEITWREFLIAKPTQRESASQVLKQKGKKNKRQKMNAASSGGTKKATAKGKLNKQSLRKKTQEQRGKFNMFKKLTKRKLKKKQKKANALLRDHLAAVKLAKARYLKRKSIRHSAIKCGVRKKYKPKVAHKQPRQEEASHWRYYTLGGFHDDDETVPDVDWTKVKVGRLKYHRYSDTWFRKGDGNVQWEHRSNPNFYWS